MDPYQELGVPKDADAAAIKAAYRKRSRATHPDKGGATADFQRASAAYRLLADPVRRARYDATGEADAGVDNEAARLLSILANLVLGVVNTVDVAHQDVMREVCRRIDSDFEAVKQAKKEVHKKIARFEKAAKRVRRKSAGDNAVAGILTAEAEKMKAILAQHDTNLEMLHRLDEMAKDYDYLVDEQEPTANYVFISVK